jgi:hypothetical protein
VTQADYTRLGEPAVLTLSTGGPIAQMGYYYDETTRRTNRILNVRQTAPSTVADLNLTYDASGNVTKLADTPTGGTADTNASSTTASAGSRRRGRLHPEIVAWPGARRL